jgi:hypothetical protein
LRYSRRNPSGVTKDLELIMMVRIHSRYRKLPCRRRKLATNGQGRLQMFAARSKVFETNRLRLRHVFNTLLKIIPPTFESFDPIDCFSALQGASNCDVDHSQLSEKIVLALMKDRVQVLCVVHLNLNRCEKTTDSS